jgi:hypothetical protein
VRDLITATATGERDGPDGHATRSACVMLRKALDPTAAEARRQGWPMAWRPSTAAAVVLAVLGVTWVLSGTDPRLSPGDNVNGVLVFRAPRAERLAFTLTAQSDVGPDNLARGDMVVLDAAKGATRYPEARRVIEMDRSRPRCSPTPGGTSWRSLRSRLRTESRFGATTAGATQQGDSPAPIWWRSSRTGTR